MSPLHDSVIIFRSHRLGFFITLGMLLGVGAAVLDRALHHHPGWFIATALLVVGGARLVSRYAIGSLALRGADLIIYEGTLVIQEHRVPIWDAAITIQQSLLGRGFDTGTVIVTINERPIRRCIAHLRAFRQLLSDRRRDLLVLVNRHRATHAVHPIQRFAIRE